MKHIIAFVFFFGALNLVETEFSQAAQNAAAPLNDFEIYLSSRAIEPSRSFARKNIVLVWPNSWKPSFEKEANVKSPENMADWLDRAYDFMIHWTGFDPNEFYRKQNGVKDRLVFVLDGGGDFNFGIRRPFIALRDGKDPLAGTGDWFGWLSHELSHDFWHRHPAFRSQRGDWGEGMCDFSRFHLLRAMGMVTSAFRDYDTYMKASYENRYHGGARLLLEFQDRNDFEGPFEVWNALRTQSLSGPLLRPPWAYQKASALNRCASFISGVPGAATAKL